MTHAVRTQDRDYQRDWKRKWRETPEGQAKNRARAAAWHADKKANDPDYYNKRNARAFGLSLCEYKGLYSKKDGKCHICGDSLRRGKGGCAVDHCHTSGKVRGMLCGGCNKALGLFKDDPERMRAAADYLDKQGKREILEE